MNCELKNSTEVKKIRKTFPHLSIEEVERLYWLVFELTVVTNCTFDKFINIIDKSLKGECTS